MPSVILLEPRDYFGSNAGSVLRSLGDDVNKESVLHILAMHPLLQLLLVREV